MKINIPYPVYEQIMHWVKKADYEVSGFGKCAYNPETGDIDVYSAHLLKQEGSGAMTDIDAASLSKLMFTTKDNPGELKLWWHSHVRMQAFWSGTDTNTIKELGANGWCIAIVFNQMEEYKAAYCGQVQRAYGPTELDLEDDIDMEIAYPDIHPDMRKSWDAEFDANVTRKTYVYTGPLNPLTGYNREDYVGDKAWDRPGNVYDATKRTTSLLLPGDQGYDDDKWERDWARKEAAARDEEKDPGMAIEAAACGMTYEAYIEALERCDSRELAAIDEKLTKYWNAEDEEFKRSTKKVKEYRGSNR